jgi:purine-binding chemotaxis protein CheW
MAEERDRIIIEADEYEEERLPQKVARVLVFSLGGETYGIDIKQARSVVKPDAVTRVPNMPEFITGVMNLRGDVISLVDIRYFFGLAQRERTDGARAIVVDSADGPVGIVVDSIKFTLDVPEDSIQPPLATLNEKLAGYTKGEVQMETGILVLLDLSKVLASDEISALKKGDNT